MTDRITDEMVEAAAREFFRACFYEPDEIDQHQKRQSGGWLRTVFAARAALSAALPLMDGWQPIETAPKDNKARLVWCPAWRNTYIVSWVVPLDDKAKPNPDAGHWSHFGGGYRPLTEAPTHWMPLPPAPKGE